jgi:ankyrin repeat protein
MNFVPPQAGVLGFPGEILTPAELRAYEAREERVIDLLISAGLDPSGKEGADTPLKIVLDANHYPAARALLRHHPSLNIKDAQGNPAIVYLFNSCHSAFPLDVLETMLQQGADPNGNYPIPGLTPVTKTTVLQTAIGSFRGGRGSQLDDQRAAIKMLVDHGAKFPGVKSDADQAMLIAAVEGDQPRMKAALAKGASPDAKDSYGYSPLLLSMMLQYFDNVVWLLNNGSDPTKNSTMWGNNLIPAAVSANRLDMVKLLLSKGLKPSGYELNAAVENGNREMFDTLIKAGADPKGGSVFTCMQRGQPEMAKILLDGGADPQPPPFGENRANVYWAVYYNQPEILKAMLDHGADPTYISAYGETPLSEARQWHKDMVPIIEDALKRWPQLSAGGPIPVDMQDLAQKAANDLKQADYDKASAKFEQMTKAHPDSLFAWSNLGASRFQRMRYTDARDAFEHAVKLKPDDAFAVFNLGMTYYRLDAFDKALATLKTAIQLVPNDANAHYFLGVTYASLRQQKEADAEFQKTKDLQLKAAASASH